MKAFDRSPAGPTTLPPRRKLNRDTVFLIGDLLPICDFTGVLLAAWFSTLMYAHWVEPAATSAGLLVNAGRAALGAAMIAPFILCERAYVSLASRAQTAALVRCYATRFPIFAGIVAAIGLGSRSLASLPQGWLGLWFTCALLITALIRVLLMVNLQRLERHGILRETVAVVGAGRLADELIQHLLRRPGSNIEIIGVFEDFADDNEAGAHPPHGSIADLVELGKSRSMDWILLALPASDANRLPFIVRELKGLAVPIGRCPAHFGSGIPGDVTRYSDASLPVMALGNASRWDAALAAVEILVPRWMLTLIGLPFSIFSAVSFRFRGVWRLRPAKLAWSLDNDDLGGSLHRAPASTANAQRTANASFGKIILASADVRRRAARRVSQKSMLPDTRRIE